MPYYNVLQTKTAKATASSTYSNFTPDKTIDGSGSSLNNNSRWVSGASTVGEWLQVDIGSLVRINKFVLYTGNSADNIVINGNAIANGDFQIWQNDQWKTVGSFRNNGLMNSKVEVKLDKFYKTDKVRLYFPISEPQYRVFEIEAYGRVLGKLAKNTTSKNLLKSFTSAEWNYTVSIVDQQPNRIVLNLPSSKTNELIIPAKPNTTYTLSGKTDGRVYFVQRQAGNVDKAGTGLSNYGTFTRTITTGSDVVGLRVSLTTDDAGIKFFENLMLNEGGTALPYQVYEQNMRQARLIPKKNIFTLDDSFLTTAGGSSFTLTSPNDVTVTSGTNGFTAVVTKRFKVKQNTQYTLSYKAEKINSIDAPRVSPRKGSDGSGITLSDGEGVKTLTFNTGNETEIYILLYANLATTTAPQTNKYTSIQLEEGSVATSFVKYHGTNKPATKVPKKNLIDYSTTVLRNGTTAFTITGDRIDFDATRQDYAGVNFVTPDVWLVGKTVTWSYDDKSAGITPMLSYQAPGAQVLTYIGISSGQKSRTVTIPAGSTSVRFYIQNDAGQRGNFYIKGFQAEIGSVATPYEKFRYVNKPAVLNQPKKNFLKGFTKWGAEASAGMTYEVMTDRKVIINFNSVSQYVGLQMSPDYSELYQLRGKTVTLSAKAIDRYTQSNTQVQMRFWGGASGNVDFVLSNTQLSSTKVVPADFTGFFIKIQTNIIGTTKIMVEDLQLEIGEKTNYEPYILGSKQAKY